MTGKNRRTRRKCCRGDTSSTTIPHGLTRVQAWALAVGGRRLNHLSHGMVCSLLHLYIMLEVVQPWVQKLASCAFIRRSFVCRFPSRWWCGRTYCSLRIITIPIIYKYCKRNKEFKYLLSDSSVVFFKFVQTILLYFRNYCRSMTNRVLTGRSWRKIICNGDLFSPIIVGNQPIFCLHDFSYRVNSLMIFFFQSGRKSFGSL
jgi:hypothetical protein